MRIVYVLTSLGIGGAERQVAALASGMARRGHEVALLVLRPRLKEEWSTDQPVVSLGMGKTPLSVLRAFIRGRRFLRNFHPDIVHSHSFHANIFSRILSLAAPVPVILSTVHNANEGGWHRMLAYRVTDALSRRTTAVSKAAADRFVQLKAIPREKCIVVPNGFEPDKFLPDPNRRPLIRGEIGEPNSAFIWLAAGRIAAAKDYPNLLRAFAQVRLSRQDAKLWIAGEYSPEFIAPLLKLAAELRLGDSLVWLGLRRDIPALLDACDGFVQASAWEGMPLSIGEAMCMEKPVVATNVGGVRELIGETGLVTEPHDPQTLAESMLEVMRRPVADRLGLGRRARQRIEQFFRMDDRIADWEQLYFELLPARG